MLNEDDIRFQLDRYYRGIENTKSDRQNIRKWCLTIWLAILGMILTGKLDMAGLIKYIVAILPIVVFWFFEAITATHTLLLESRAAKLEEYSFTKVDLPNPMDHFYVSGHYSVPFGEKIGFFVAALIKLETIVFFYTPLILLSVVTVGAR